MTTDLNPVARFLAGAEELTEEQLREVQVGLDRLASKTKTRIAVHHTGSDTLLKWDTGLHGPQPLSTFNPAITPSLLDYFDTIEYCLENPTHEQAIKLSDEFKRGFAREVIANSRCVYTQGNSGQIHNWQSNRKQAVSGVLVGPSGRLVDVPDAQSLTNMLFRQNNPAYVANVFKKVIGKDLHIFRWGSLDAIGGPNREFNSSLYLTPKELILNLTVSEYSLRHAHGLEVTQR